MFEDIGEGRDKVVSARIVEIDQRRHEFVRWSIRWMALRHAARRTVIPRDAPHAAMH
ncbi:hypothetical protein [Bradyrhizobium sp. JR3.5]